MSSAPQSAGRVRIRDKVFEPFLRAAEIETALARLAAELNVLPQAPPPVFVPALKGAYRFWAGLIPHLAGPYGVEFVRASSYGAGMKSSGEVKLAFDPAGDLKGRTLVVLEDVVETGRTTDAICAELARYEPGQILLCALLFKPGAFIGARRPDLTGFEIGAEFVVGYGMDYAEEGRWLPEIYRLPPA